MLLAYCPNPTY